MTGDSAEPSFATLRAIAILVIGFAEGAPEAVGEAIAVPVGDPQATNTATRTAGGKGLNARRASMLPGSRPKSLIGYGARLLEIEKGPEQRSPLFSCRLLFAVSLVIDLVAGVSVTGLDLA